MLKIFIIVWLILALSQIIVNNEDLAELGLCRRTLAILILVIGAPFFEVAGILTALLDYIAPEVDWEEED